MSVQKTSKNVDYLRQPKKPFEMIYRQILEKLKDADALAVYCHLSGKPDNWEINDQYIMNHFGWGRDKARRAVNCLIVNHLMVRIQWVDEKGQFSGRNTDLLDGYDFKEYIEYDKKVHKKLIEYRQRTDLSTIQSPWPEKPSYGLSVDGKQAATIEDIKAFKKEDKKQERALSVYKPTEDQKRLAKELNVDIEKELVSFFNKHRGKKTHEEFENWLRMACEYQNKKKIVQNSEIHSTVKEYGQGHPTWEANQKWEREHARERQEANLRRSGSGSDHLRAPQKNVLPGNAMDRVLPIGRG